MQKKTYLKKRYPSLFNSFEFAVTFGSSKNILAIYVQEIFGEVLVGRIPIGLNTVGTQKPVGGDLFSILARFWEVSHHFFYHNQLFEFQRDVVCGKLSQHLEFPPLRCFESVCYQGFDRFGV